MAEENRNMFKTYVLTLQYSSEITYNSSGLDSVNVTEILVLKVMKARHKSDKNDSLTLLLG
jgi:hypothetical protein